MADNQNGKQRICFLLILSFIFSLGMYPDIATATTWSLFTDSEQQIQFLSIGKPDKSQSQDDGAETITWQFGYLEDGTSGYVDATRLKQGSFAGFDVSKEAVDLRSGIEAGGRTKVTYEQSAKVSGVPAVEFTTETLTSSGNTWYGVVRMFVLDDTLYTVGITAPTLSRLETAEAQAFLDSLKQSE